MKRIAIPMTALLLTAGAGIAQEDELRMVLERCIVAKTQPQAAVKGFGTMSAHPILGNGCLMVTVAGLPECQTLYIGKTDFWRDRGKNQKDGAGWQSGNVLAGYLNIRIPSMAGADFRQVQDLYLAEARTTLTKEGESVEIRALTPHEADHFIFTDLTNQGTRDVPVTVETCTDQFSGKLDPFEVAAGHEGDVAWVTRKTHVPPPNDGKWGDCAFRMWAAIATRILGATAEHAADNEWSYEKSKLQVKAAAVFTLKPGQSIRIVTQVTSTGLPITPEPADPKPAALKALAAIDAQKADELVAGHRAWWDAYWRKAWIRLDCEPLVERVWYGALYVLACANRPGQWPAGCNGWPVDDHVPWGGDYHWNYNHQAPYYGAYSSNRIEITEPYDRAVLAANEYGKRYAASLKAPGTFFFIATAPGHLNEALTIDQKTHAVEASMNLINRWYMSLDLDWMKRHYAFFRDVADYWDADLQRHKETRENGSYRYVVADSGPMEGAHNDRFNGITGLAFLRRFYRAMTDITRELNAAGFETGRGDADLARWQDFLFHLSDYPMSFAYGRKVFAWSEQSLNPLLTEQDWILYPVFPAEQVSISSDPKLLQVARNTLIIKPQYYVEWLNNPPQIFAIAARLGHHPPEVLGRFNAYFKELGVSNFKSGGGNVEGAGLAEGINNFLLQSHEGFLRLFPCWHHPEARFVNLRAAGAFLVSADRKDGVCQPITLASEKGRPCAVLNPWPGKTLDVKSADGRTVEASVEYRPYGQVCTFSTEAGQRYVVSAKEGLPAKAEWPNAALGKPVTVSSSHQPGQAKEVWDATKLTDGTRICTKVGHRGWSSALHEDPNHPEWAQVDLGEPVKVRCVNLWPIDHGDAWQHTHCMEPFVQSDEIDQSYDGFPLDFRILVSVDGEKWDEVAKRQAFRKPSVGPDHSDRKPADVTGPEAFSFSPRSIRYVKVDVTRLRKTRFFGKYAAQLAEVEVLRADAASTKTQ